MNNWRQNALTDIGTILQQKGCGVRDYALKPVSDTENTMHITNRIMLEEMSNDVELLSAETA